MLSKSYKNCILTPEKVGFLIQFVSGAKVLIDNTQSFKDCLKWLDRQLPYLVIEKGFGNQ